MSLPLLALLWTTAGWSATPNDALRCLRDADLVCAQGVRDELQADDPGSVEALQVEAWTRFHEGRYPAMVTALDALGQKGVRLEDEDNQPFRATAEAALGMEEISGDGVRVRTSPGIDRILQREAVEAMEASRLTYDGLLGGGPSHPVVLDVFPTASRFIAASGLPPEAVNATGVVALSKWTRLLLTSPRALSRGYAWKDTIAHEYIHLVVSYRTRDRAPVWLQEGLAKYLEGHWQQDTGRYLSVHQQSLLADALRNDGFVPFEKFRRSMAYLDSGEEAALAFAQVATMVGYLIETAGEEALPPLLERVGDGESAEAVVADLAGHADFEDFRSGWMGYIGRLPLVQERLAALPVLLDGSGEEADADPILAGNLAMRRYLRLGDLLREAGRPKAALVEYGKAQATAEDEPPSPMLLARKAECWSDMGDTERALDEAQRSVSLYPEFTLAQVVLGRIHLARGEVAQGVAAFQSAHDLNPYDPEVQRALTQGYQELGDAERAQRHLDFSRILATGGSIDAL